MDRARIVLADPPMTKSRHADTQSFPNIGILSLFGYLREKMPDLDLYYLNGTLDLRQHLECVAAISPYLYGLSFASTMESVAYETMNRVKETNPDLPVICGGCHPTALPNTTTAPMVGDCYG